jgi:hypothetical protein
MLEVFHLLHCLVSAVHLRHQLSYIYHARLYKHGGMFAQRGNRDCQENTVLICSSFLEHSENGIVVQL